jgi:peptide deformylase
MAVLKIARMGHPVLLRRADSVVDPTAPDLARLAADMIETMHDAPGVGLAAPQVHVSLRLIVFWVPRARADDPDAPEGSARGPVAPTILVNPEIEEAGDACDASWERCLSLPGLTGLVSRPRQIRYAGMGLNGERIARVAEGFHARVVQHECDHLDGILYPRRMTDLSRLGFVEDVSRYGLARPEG